MIKDQHGNHVIQKIIEKGFCDDIMRVKKDYNNKNEKVIMANVVRCLNKILVNIKSMVYELCIHALGCRVVQKVIECIPSELIEDYVFLKIEEHFQTLSEDKYGNYVIQHILQYGD